MLFNACLGLLVPVLSKAQLQTAVSLQGAIPCSSAALLESGNRWHVFHHLGVVTGIGVTLPVTNT
jgi:hypothetical protein